MALKIAVLPGDGIGPEVSTEGLRILSAVTDKFGIEFETTTALVGGAAYEAVGHPLPTETLDICRKSAP